MKKLLLVFVLLLSVGFTTVGIASDYYSDYKDAKWSSKIYFGKIDWSKVSWWDKQIMGITYANCKKKLARAKKNLAYHEKNYSSAKDIAKAKADLKEKQWYCDYNSRPYEEDFWNDLADNFYLLALMFFVGLGFLLYPIAKKLCNPRLWEQAKKNINKN